MAKVDFVQALNNHALEIDEYLAILDEHEKRTQSRLKAVSGGNGGDPRRISEYSLVLRQVFLHRSMELIKAAGFALAHENGYALALGVRAHFETTASIGYLHYRLHSLIGGHISHEVMDKDICTQLLGSRDEGILKLEGADALEAKQILTMLEYADKSVSRHIMGGKANEHKMLLDIYTWLCEFCHPNFHSNKLAFHLNRSEGAFDFRYGSSLEEGEAKILENLFLSAPILLKLFDDIEGLALGVLNGS